MTDIDYKNDFTIYNSVRAGWLQFVEDWVRGNPYPSIPETLNKAKACVLKLRKIPLNDKKLKRLGLSPISELAKAVLKDVFKLTEEEAENKCREAGLFDVLPVKKAIVIREPKVYTERGITYMFQSIVKKNAAIKFLGPKVTARHKWLLDVIAHILNYRAIQIKAGNDNGENIEIVTFNDDDVRKITGRYKLSGREIKKLFEDLRLVHVVGESEILYDDGRWVKIEAGGPLFVRHIVKEWGIASKRTGIPTESKIKHQYVLSLNTNIGTAEICNLLCGKVLALPQRIFYQLGLQEQEIYRYFAMRKGHPFVQLDYTQMCKLLALSTTARYPDRQIERISGWLDELKESGLLNWEKIKQGRKTIFFLSLKKALLPVKGLIGE